jgi:thioredoxin reductase
VGGGPAGLSAALVLGRACRRVILFDSGRYRNAVAHQIHGFLSRDAMPPLEFLEVSRKQLESYPSVRFERSEVSRAEPVGPNSFRVTTIDGQSFTSRRLLLATGVVDHVPAVEGFVGIYGVSAFHCPYCDGWEFRDQPIAVYGRGARAYGFALEMLGWTRDIIVCSDGPCEMSDHDRAHLGRNGITVREERILRFEHTDGRLNRVVFDGAPPIDRAALFFTMGQIPASPLAESLGCAFNDKGTVPTGKYQVTSVPGLFVAGDASRDVQWIIVAAAEGAEAAYAINQGLIQESIAP